MSWVARGIVVILLVLGAVIPFLIPAPMTLTPVIFFTKPGAEPLAVPVPAHVGAPSIGSGIRNATVLPGKVLVTGAQLVWRTIQLSLADILPIDEPGEVLLVVMIGVYRLVVGIPVFLVWCFYLILAIGTLPGRPGYSVAFLGTFAFWLVMFAWMYRLPRAAVQEA